jgi:MFS family permease
VSETVVQGRWQARVGGLPPAFWALWTGTLVNRFGTFVFPFLSIYLTGSRRFSVGQAGLVLTFLGLGSALSQPLGGVLADRFGRRRTMVGGLVSAAATLLLLGATRPLPLLCGAALLFGVAADVYRPASEAAIADLVDEEHRPRAFALVFWAVNVGFAFASLMGGLLAEHGFVVLFVADAVSSLGFALIVLRLVPETRPQGGAEPGSLLHVLRDRLMLALVAGVVLESVAYMQSFFTLPLAITQDGLGPSSYGVAIGLNCVLIVALQPLLLGVLGRRTRGPLLVAGGVLTGVGFGLTWFADSLPAHLAVVTVWTVGEILASGQLSALVAQIAPAAVRGRYMGVFGASFGLATFLAPALGTQVLEHLGEGALWGGCLVLGLASGAVLYAVSRAADLRS